MEKAIRNLTTDDLRRAMRWTVNLVDLEAGDRPGLVSFWHALTLALDDERQRRKGEAREAFDVLQFGPEGARLAQENSKKGRLVTPEEEEALQRGEIPPSLLE